MGQTPRPADELRIGQVFLGKYRVESILGQGGMGVVAECTHLGLDERVAIKMLRQDVLLDRDAVERFTREAQSAAKLKSEYVAKVRDVGVFENGVPFMVMEFLEGHDLGDLIKERGHLPVPWACELMLQTCEALAEAHSLGIVHRDVKPTNLFVTWRPDGTALVKVLDFGISKSPMGTDMQLTQTQSLLGTPAYMSPEQMRSARLVDARTDIWSLGTVMYELLEGRKPFEAESFSEMCVKVAVDAPQPMVNAPPDLQQVVLKCLAKSPDQRYATMADLGRDLVPFAQDTHQASMLVERMHRMLRRSEGGWEGSTTGVGMRGVPNHVRDVGSAPVRAANPGAWHGGSEPSGVRWNAGSDPAHRWHGGSEPSAQMFRTPLPTAPNAGAIPLRHPGREPSAPARAPSEVLAIPKRSRLPWIIVGGVLVGAAGILLALTVLGEEPAPAPANAITDVEPATPVDTAPAVKPLDTAPAVDKPVDPALSPDKPGDKTGDGTVDDTGDKTADKTGDKTGDKPADKPADKTVTKTGTKTGAKTGTKTGTKTGAKTGTKKEPQVKETPVVKEEPVVKKACDPYDNPHGCDGKK